MTGKRGRDEGRREGGNGGGSNIYESIIITPHENGVWPQ